MSKSYQKVKELSKKGALLESIHNLLEWDQETFMPKNGIKLRTEQLELIASLSHKERTSTSFKNALSHLIDLATGQIKDHSLSDEEIAACREWRRDYLKAIKLPGSFVKQFAKTTSKAIHIWSEAKTHNRFEDFAPYLEKVVVLCRKKAKLLGFEKHPYDALIDIYEPGMTTEILDELFSKLKISLTHLLQQIEAKGLVNDKIFTEDFPHSQQIHFGKHILHCLGLTSDISRLDLSSHPFCNALSPSDVRLTTRVIPNNPLSNIFSVIHEAGHGIYEAQLNEEHFGTPLGSSVSLGLHESQSRLWETIIGKSYPFWQYFYPLFQKEFPQQLTNITFDNFFRTINKVSASLIRTESDEVTYCLHIIIRYELEKSLIDGSLKVKDLPMAWNEKMRDYLGISPSTDAEGCMQDIHWSMGGIGYFPTYALGNLYAAQFFETFMQTYPIWMEDVKNGKLEFIKEWLKENIHKHGRRYEPCDLVMKITGKKLEETSYIKYLSSKFKKIYSL